MASGKRIGIIAVAVLIVAIIGFYLWQSGGDSAEPSLSIETDTALPPPTPPATVNRGDPSMTADAPASSATTTSSAPVDLSIDINTLLEKTAPPAPAAAPASAATTTSASPTTPAAATSADSTTTQLKPLSPAELGALASTTGGTTSAAPISTSAALNQPRTTTSSDAAASSTYIVRQGDSMWSIAERTLGSGARWPQIAQANPSVNPDALQPGDRLIIPAAQTSPAPSAAAVASAAGSTSGGGRTIVVAEGETLWSIAQREYGDGTLWQVIYEANQDRLRNPNDLRFGERIRIPSLSR